METSPEDLDARMKISITILSNFSRNENSHAVVTFFKKLLAAPSDKIKLTSAHFTIYIKEQLRLDNEKEAMEAFETMKKKYYF